mmetsp:Transcript_3383/g.10521  ORF Transcript_3383/g.10521 Transcript_3383/m.10521 type:complete len:272 (+) Transcript_3383:391-1206(+)
MPEGLLGLPAARGRRAEDGAAHEAQRRVGRRLAAQRARPGVQQRRESVEVLGHAVQLQRGQTRETGRRPNPKTHTIRGTLGQKVAASHCAGRREHLARGSESPAAVASGRCLPQARQQCRGEAVEARDGALHHLQQGGTRRRVRRNREVGPGRHLTAQDIDRGRLAGGRRDRAAEPRGAACEQKRLRGNRNSHKLRQRGGLLWRVGRQQCREHDQDLVQVALHQPSARRHDLLVVSDAEELRVLVAEPASARKALHELRRVRAKQLPLRAR